MLYIEIDHEGERNAMMNETDVEIQSLSIQSTPVEEICRLGRCLSVPKRVEILRLIENSNIMSVNSIAKALDLPISTVSVHVSILEEAGLIVTEKTPSLHGKAKMCYRRNMQISLRLGDTPANPCKTFEQQLPVGGFSMTEHVTLPCGMASVIGPIGTYNRPACFFLPERLQAQVLWMQAGSVTYEFAPLLMPSTGIEELRVSFEACSQAPNDQPWNTLFSVSINGVLIGETNCTCEAGGQRGRLNPEWWPDVATQSGVLYKWRVTCDGSYLEDKPVSATRLQDLRLREDEPICLTITVPQGDHQAGINLFGSDAGDYRQSISLSILYRKE